MKSYKTSLKSFSVECSKPPMYRYIMIYTFDIDIGTISNLQYKQQIKSPYATNKIDNVKAY